MQKIQLRSQVGTDGILHLDVPIEFTETELEITLTVQAISAEQNSSNQTASGITKTTQSKGYPPNFFEETFGCLKDNPLVIDTEGTFEEWDTLS